MASTTRDRTDIPDRNTDPLSGEAGAHPVGVGVGTAAGGAAAGAAAGAVAGPIGAAAGAVVGGVLGGLAGKSVAEHYDPTVEDAYWQESYSKRPYYDRSIAYEEIRPAYRYGWESQAKCGDKSFDEVEADLERNWASARAQSKLTWDKARHASRDAWNRLRESSNSQQCDVKK